MASTPFIHSFITNLPGSDEYILATRDTSFAVWGCAIARTLIGVLLLNRHTIQDSAGVVGAGDLTWPPEIAVTAVGSQSALVDDCFADK